MNESFLILTSTAVNFKHTMDQKVSKLATESGSPDIPVMPPLPV